MCPFYVAMCSLNVAHTWYRIWGGVLSPFLQYCDLYSEHLTEMQRLQNQTMSIGDWTDNGTGNRSIVLKHHGITSPIFHVALWIVLSAGIIGNLLVLLWRCLRKESRLQLISLLIVSLAFADLLWCSHFLLQEVMLVYPVFIASENETLSFTEKDEQLCLTTSFLGYASCNAIMLTVVAIALYSYLTFSGVRHRNKVISVFVALGWIASMSVAATAVRDFAMYYQDNGNSFKSESNLKLERFSAITMLGCLAPNREKFSRYPLIVTSINAASSIISTFIYVCLWKKVRKKDCGSGSYGNHELKQLQIRLTIIAAMNLLCWWPSCILYWLSYVREESVPNGRLSPHAVEPVFLFTVAVSAANPIIYTMASKRFVRITARCCNSVCRQCNEERRIEVYFPYQGNVGRKSHNCHWCCSALCCYRSRFQMLGSHHITDLRNPLLSLSEETEETDMFTESTEN